MLTHSLTLVNRFASGGTIKGVAVNWKREERGVCRWRKISVRSFRVKECGCSGFGKRIRGNWRGFAEYRSIKRNVNEENGYDAVKRKGAILQVAPSGQRTFCSFFCTEFCSISRPMFPSISFALRWPIVVFLGAKKFLFSETVRNSSTEGHFSRCRERRKPITVAYDREGKPEVRSEWLCDRESSILLRFRDFVALVLRGFISNSFYLSLPELFFFASVTSPPLLVLERDNAPFHGFESRLFSSSVAGLGEKVEIKTGGVS